VARLEADERRAEEALSELERVSSDETEPSAPIDAEAAAIATWEERVREARAARDRLLEERSVGATERRAAEERRAAAIATANLVEARIDRLTSDQAARGRAVADLTADRQRLAGELAAATAIEVDARESLERIRAGSASLRADLSAAEVAASSARETLRRAEDALRTAEVADVEARLSIDAVREALLVELAAMGEVGLVHLRDRLPAGTTVPESDDAEAYEAVLAAITPTWTAMAPPGDPPPPSRLATLRRRFHELGAANPFADREYAEIRDRLTSLETQEGDLRAAIDATRRLIGELNQLIANQFRTTFSALEVAFDQRFRQLFGGGFARLELTEPSDLSASGVEIVARPPGKKPQTLAMLSGGERALTAVALLFAMLEVRPVPFCVLDEVDAALDEANIGRFTDALGELAGRTQFIVITHNRGTIEIADALYGVTVGEDSVSRIVSLRLDEATAIADDRRSAVAIVSTATNG
jgi:chromosome segregation protein